MRVLHIITGLRPGGAEHQLLGIAEHTSHDITVAALACDGAVGDALRGLGVPVHLIGMRSNRDPAALYRLRKLARGFDAVGVHLYRACIWGRPAARLAGVGAVVTTEHSLGTSQLENRPIRRGVRELYLATERYSHSTIAVSGEVRDRLVAWGVPAAKIICIPNGVNLRAFVFDPVARARVRAELGIGAEEPVIGSVGRLVPTKRIAEVVRAARSLGHVVVAGDGPERGSIEAAATGGRVHVLGERTDIPALLSAFDVFVAPSVPGEETFMVGAVEALASGLPVVVSGCPALEGIDSPLVRWAGTDLRADVAAALGVPRATRAPAMLSRFSIADTVARSDAVFRDALLRRAPLQSRHSQPPPT